MADCDGRLKLINWMKWKWRLSEGSSLQTHFSMTKSAHRERYVLTGSCSSSRSERVEGRGRALWKCRGKQCRLITGSGDESRCASLLWLILQPMIGFLAFLACASWFVPQPINRFAVRRGLQGKNLRESNCLVDRSAGSRCFVQRSAKVSTDLRIKLNTSTLNVLSLYI